MLLRLFKALVDQKKGVEDIGRQGGSWQRMLLRFFKALVDQKKGGCIGRQGVFDFC